MAAIKERALMRSKSGASSLAVNGSDFERGVWKLILATRKIWKSKMLHALPGVNSTLADLEQLMATGGTRWLHFNASIRSQEYMDEHGQCMDNIRNEISAIPHAGRGAFASRFIPKGGLVSPAPLIHIPNRSAFTIYDQHANHKGKWVRDVSRPVHHQLLLNYCFGHRDSTLLLCPYGLLSGLINHDSKNPNTELRWTNRRRLRHPEWLERPIREWGRIRHTGLSFDFVALRDIEQGEEVTINYGPEWERAWEEHVKKFDTPRPRYIPAFELNKVLDLRIPTVDETNDYFDQVLMGCREHYLPHNHGVKSFYDVEEDGDPFFLCRVLERKSGGGVYRYTAEVYERRTYLKDDHDREDSYQDKSKLILFDLPRDAFFFRDLPYERDHHMPWAFRHDMRIPDDLFPDVWRNNRKTPERRSVDHEL
jgi:SET domain